MHSRLPRTRGVPAAYVSPTTKGAALKNVLSDFLPEVLPANPVNLIAQWLDEAREAGAQPNPNAMTLATVAADGRPSARIVLCKALDADAGYVDFYTNYTSRKGREIAANENVALVFHWDTFARQVRIEGSATRVPDELSDAYFASRARASQIGAWASDQSQPIADRETMAAQVARRAAELGADDQSEIIKRPPHWGGYRVWIAHCELWVEGVGRVHDRARFTRDLEALENGDFRTGDWHGTRLQP